ncbi:MAG: hypothetical protein ACREBW_03245, partial [Candidatus Micrarchaeaceae archaeon]
TFTQVYNFYMPLQFLTSLQSSLIAGKFTIIGDVFTAVQQVALIPVTAYLITPADVISGYLANGILILYGEYYFIIFLSTAAIPVFLAPGVVFRSIMPTRSLGGTMIAIALAFFIVMPSLFSIAYYFTAPSLQQQLNAAAAQMSKFSASSVNAQVSSIGPGNPLVVQLANVQQAMSDFWLQVLFYPSLILAMTYAFINQAAQFLGGPVRQMGGRIRGFI